MTKCDKGTPGQPMFKRGDKVGFYLIPYKETKEKFFEGTVEIVDRWGTFRDPDYPSYDIMVENYNNTGEKMLVKHVAQSECYIL